MACLVSRYLVSLFMQNLPESQHPMRFLPLPFPENSCQRKQNEIDRHTDRSVYDPLKSPADGAVQKNAADAASGCGPNDAEKGTKDLPPE